MRIWKTLVLSSLGAMSMAQTPDAADLRLTMPGSPLGIAWAFLDGYSGIPSAVYMPQVRKLGAHFTKVYLIWNQLEPEKGRYNWSAVDAFVNQLQAPEEGLISVFSSSTWATQRASAMLPPSPAKDPADYYSLIYNLVKHCQGRVRYWQNDAEPNNPVFWGGTRDEFIAEMKLFHKAVKDADPSAVVVLGGYDGRFNPPGMPAMHGQQEGLDFFNAVIRESRDDFDLFDLRLYGDPYTIPARVAYIRGQMQAAGYSKPIICAEYGGPNLFEFPENRKYVSLATTWTQSITGESGKPELGNGITALYDHMDTLAPQTQMFMLGCPPALEDKYQRIQSRGLVMRNILAFSAGVQKTLYWQFLAAHAERDNLMTLMYAKIGMLGEENGALTKRFPIADTYQRMAQALEGVQQVRRIEVAGQPSMFLFEVDRGKRGPLFVVWERRDAFSGEDSPAVALDFPWAAKRASALDALGHAVPVTLAGKQLSLAVSITPIFIEPGD